MRNCEKHITTHKKKKERGGERAIEGKGKGSTNDNIKIYIFFLLVRGHEPRTRSLNEERFFSLADTLANFFWSSSESK